MSVWRTNNLGLVTPVLYGGQVYFDGQNFPLAQPLSTGLTNYSLDCNAGSYSLTVGDATLTATRTLDCAAGSYTLTVGDATLEKGYTLTADGGTYALSVGAVTFDVARTITAAAGSYAITGQNASLEKGYLLTADVGSYAVTGQDATLTPGGAPGSYSLDCDSGSFSVSVGDAGLEYSASAGVTPAGKGSPDRKRRYKRKYVVAIDGQEFVVQSPEEAVTLLQAAQDALQEVISEPAKVQKQGKLPVRKPDIRIEGMKGPELTEIVSAIRDLRSEMTRMWQEAARTAEIAYLMEMQRQQDEEDALLVLL